MRVLLTNDDSIHSAALQRLVRALVTEHWEVYVAAPDSEKSGVGCGCSLTKGIRIETFEGLDCPAWAIGGTPLDCVNLAFSHLLEGKIPDVVISGINWGVNTSIPMIFCSGTVGGAIEGATFGVPSIAVSQCLPGQEGRYIQKKINFLAHEGLMRSIDAAVERTVLYAEEIGKTSENVVHNINFPYPMTSQTEKEMTRLSNIMHGKGALYPLHGSLYEKEGEEYVFAVEQDLDTSITPLPGTDIDALMRGKVSHTVVDLRRLC